MEGRGEGVAVSKPTGANKRKGANPVRQIINDGVVADGGGVGGGGGPLDLSLQHGDMQPRSSSKKVILSVPQYKLVTSSSTTSASALSVSSSSRLSDPPPAPVTSLKQEPGELSVTPVIKKERLSGSDEDEEDLEILSETIIQKYDDLQVKLEPVEEEGDHPASRVVSLMKKSRYFTEHPNMFSVCSESEAGTFARELRFLPGWRVKTMEVRRKTGEVARTSYFLSPDQVQLLSGISVIEYLRVTGQPDQIIDLTSRKMKISQKTLQQYRLNYY